VLDHGDDPVEFHEVGPATGRAQQVTRWHSRMESTSGAYSCRQPATSETGVQLWPSKSRLI